MAIATNGGHVARALDFYNAAGKYFIIGGTSPWTHLDESGEVVVNDTVPNPPSLSDYKLLDVVGLKRVDNVYLVIPTDETENVISYRNQNWKRVTPSISTTVGESGVTKGQKIVPVASVAGLTIGSRLRIDNQYEGKIESITGLNVKLDTEAPQSISAGSPVLGGAFVEGAKYVYVECYLEYDNFPIFDSNNKPLSYRQIGLCTGVLPNTENILKSAAYTTAGKDEYTSLGNLEILDNRAPSNRDISQRELLSMIIEF